VLRAREEVEGPLCGFLRQGVEEDLVRDLGGTLGFREVIFFAG